MQSLITYTPVLGVVALVLALFLAAGIKRLSPGTVVMQEYQASINDATEAFLNRFYIIAAGVALAAFIILGFIHNWIGAGIFLCGALASLLVINKGIANLIKTGTRAAGNPLKAQALMLCGASITGLLLMALVMLGCSLAFFGSGNAGVALFLLGLSLIIMLYAVGSSIFSVLFNKLAERDAFLLTRLPVMERLPGIFQSGSTTLDLFESCTIALAGAMTIGALGMKSYGFGGLLLPLSVFAAAVLACMAALLAIIVFRNQDQFKVIGRTLILYTLFLVLFSLLEVKYLLPREQIRIFLSIAAGLGTAIFLLLPLGLEFPPFFKNDDSQSAWDKYHRLIATPAALLALLFSYYIAGLYGVSITTLAVLMFAGIVAFARSLEGIQEFTGHIATSIDETEETTAEADTEIAATIDNSTKALNYYSIIAMAFAALTLLMTWVQVARVGKIEIFNGLVLISLLIGGALPFLFRGWIGESQMPADVNDDQEDSEDEIISAEDARSSLLENGIDYISKKSLLVVLVAAAIPLLTGYLLGKPALVAMLTGAGIAGILLIISKANMGSGIAYLNVVVKFMFVISLAMNVV
jgi:K(+)-stimulated pyrophosphate-energized sodium pump